MTMQLIVIFQDGGRRHLGFSKFEIFNVRNGQEGRLAPRKSFDILALYKSDYYYYYYNCITVPNFVEIAPTAAEILW